MQKLGNYVTGKWLYGSGDGTGLFNAVTGEKIGTATTEGLDFASMLEYARKVGNPALRKLTFHERGRMLRALASYLSDKKEAAASPSQGGPFMSPEGLQRAIDAAVAASLKKMALPGIPIPTSYKKPYSAHHDEMAFPGINKALG